MVCACIFPPSPTRSITTSLSLQAQQPCPPWAHRQQARVSLGHTGAERPALAPTFPPPPSLPPFLAQVCEPISWPHCESKKSYSIEADSYQETGVAETSNVSFGSPLRARARPRLPSLLSGRRRRRRSPLLTLKEASKLRLAAVTAGTKPFSPSEHGNRRGNVENVEGGRHCSCTNLSFPNTGNL